MRRSKILDKWSRGEPALLTTLRLTDPQVWELVGLLGFDGARLDLEHQTIGGDRVRELLRAARAGDLDVLVRIAKGSASSIGGLLECGATGVLYPCCSDAEEAKAVVRWAKLPPLGRRGVETLGADAPYGALPVPKYLEEANRETLVVVRIEDARGVDHARAIAEVQGVDGLFFGPADFAVRGGIAAQLRHPSVERAVEVVAEAARRAGKPWGISCYSPEHAREVLDQGARLLECGSDLLTLRAGLERLQTDFAPLGLRFDRRI